MMKPYIESLGEIASKLVDDLCQIIAFPIDIDVSEPQLEPRGNFWLNIKDPLEHVSLSAYSLFTYVSRSATLKRLLKTYQESIRQQTQGCDGKIRNELLSRVEEGFKKFYKTFDQSASDTITAISTALQRAMELQFKDAMQQRQVTAGLDEKMAWLESTRKSLAQCRSDQ